MAKKPNILFIITDDQRFDTIHALGNDEIITPNLDKLMGEGMTFTNAHIAGGTCGAVCMPSRAMVLTGRNPFRLQGLGENIPDNHITMPENFKNNGYETIGLGKFHNGTPAYARSFTQGAKIFFGGMWDHWNVPTCRYDPYGNYDNVINFTVDFYNKNTTEKQHCDEFSPGKHSSELLSDAAIDLMKKNAGGDKPWMMYLAYLAPHDPRTMPESFKAMYDPDKIKLPPNFQKEIDTNYPLMVHRDEALTAYPREEEETKRNIAEYYAMITHLDSEIGRVLEALEETGERDNTIIVFTADNGLAVGQHGWMGKEDIYEHGIRVPLIICGKGIEKGSRNSAYVYLYDIYPTLCDMIGVDIPDSVEGRSFKKLLSGEENTFRDEMYLIFDKFVRGIKDDRYKLIEYRNGDSEGDKWTFLYDLKNDPWETKNLAKDDNHRDRIISMRKRMLYFRDLWQETQHEWGKDFWNRFSIDDKTV